MVAKTVLLPKLKDKIKNLEERLEAVEGKLPT